MKFFQSGDLWLSNGDLARVIVIQFWVTTPQLLSSQFHWLSIDQVSGCVFYDTLDFRSRLSGKLLGLMGF